MFESYNGGMPVNEIEITGPDGSEAHRIDRLPPAEAADRRPSLRLKPTPRTP
jgi:hypothetical protein